MRFLLDTNVVSELRKGERANAGVREWIASVEGDDFALSVLVVGEIRLGILRVGRRDAETAARLTAWASRLERAYRGRTLPVDVEVARIWARLNAERPLPVIDSLQAATALAHGLTLVTRNVGELRDTGVPVHNPFSG